MNRYISYWSHCSFKPFWWVPCTEGLRDATSSRRHHDSLLFEHTAFFWAKTFFFSSDDTCQNFNELWRQTIHPCGPKWKSSYVAILAISLSSFNRFTWLIQFGKLLNQAFHNMFLKLHKCLTKTQNWGQYKLKFFLRHPVSM